ncbi:unnamed protein product [Prorocentrum cordatum]|uniref:Uncharacterized protein n=1 Tax=Prorocentrum cordatum TaxID=2364126 RepID=A0ABN9VDJ5_9DINO|nr:unnamed protein product [Polarella glacialis]
MCMMVDHDRTTACASSPRGPLSNVARMWESTKIPTPAMDNPVCRRRHGDMKAFQPCPVDPEFKNNLHDSQCDALYKNTPTSRRFDPLSARRRLIAANVLPGAAAWVRLLVWPPPWGRAAPERRRALSANPLGWRTQPKRGRRGCDDADLRGLLFDCGKKPPTVQAGGTCPRLLKCRLELLDCPWYMCHVGTAALLGGCNCHRWFGLSNLGM